MIVRREIKIKGSIEARLKFKDNLLGLYAKEWKAYELQDEDYEEFGFEYTGSQYPKAKVRLTVNDDPNVWGVYNVTMKNGEPADIDLWNALTLKYKRDILNKVEHNGISVVMTKDKRNLMEEIGKRPTQAFEHFDKLADRRIGYKANYYDMERWFLFVYELSKSRKRYEYKSLHSIMIEDYGWNEKIADTLIDDCRFGIELIKFCKDKAGHYEPLFKPLKIL